MKLAIIWDFDGTLIDTSTKNYNVTKKIIESIQKYSLPFDLTKDNYQLVTTRSRNWRELYLNEFGMNEKQTNKAGELWTQYQLEDETPITPFPGIIKLLKKTSHLPQGIVSQNSRENIFKLLKENEIDQYFQSIIGYEEVELNHQKPHPEGILNCLKELEINQGKVVYIGDHETDINTAINAAVELNKNDKNINVHTIAAFYGSQDDPKYWKSQPDSVANEVTDIYNYLKVVEER